MAYTSKKIILNSDGSAWRPNVHILDVCKAIQYAVEFESSSSKPIILNVGDDTNNIRVIDIAEIITKSVPGSNIELLEKDKLLMPSENYELIRDRKVQGGVDSRTYKVSFEKIKKTFAGYECEWTINEGVSDMINKFEAISINNDQFKSIDFYRLQKYEYMFKNGLITNEMYWKQNFK